MTNLIIGGLLVMAELEPVLSVVIPELSGGEYTYDDVRGVLANLYDVEIGGGCDGLSVGLVGEATAL